MPYARLDTISEEFLSSPLNFSQPNWPFCDWPYPVLSYAPNFKVLLFFNVIGSLIDPAEKPFNGSTALRPRWATLSHPHCTELQAAPRTDFASSHLLTVAHAASLRLEGGSRAAPAPLIGAGRTQCKVLFCKKPFYTLGARNSLSVCPQSSLLLLSPEPMGSFFTYPSPRNNSFLRAAIYLIYHCQQGQVHGRHLHLLNEFFGLLIQQLVLRA